MRDRPVLKPADSRCGCGSTPSEGRLPGARSGDRRQHHRRAAGIRAQRRPQRLIAKSLERRTSISVLHCRHVEVGRLDIRDRRAVGTATVRAGRPSSGTRRTTSTARDDDRCARGSALTSRTPRRSRRSRCTRRCAAPTRSSRRSSAACGVRRPLRRWPATSRTPDSSRAARRRARRQARRRLRRQGASAAGDRRTGSRRARRSATPGRAPGRGGPRRCESRSGPD